MHSKPAVLPLAAILLGLTPACLETEEVIEVRANGSVEVTVTATGDEPDLSSGYPVPTWGPWRGADQGSANWLAGAPAPRPDPSEGKVQVAVRADFASVDQLPAYFAPADALYRTADVERSTTLDIQHKGGRTVYVFERRMWFKARPEWSPEERIDEEIPVEVQEALSEGRRIRPHQFRAAVRVAQDAYRDAFDSMTHQALLAIYLEGGAELSADGCERVRAAVRSAVVDALDEGRLARLVEFMREEAARSEDDDHRVELPEDLDLDLVARAATRIALPAALHAEGLDLAVNHAVVERLEWAFSAVDNAMDRGDESMNVRLRLPGRLVGGNFDSIDHAGRAQWKLEGQEGWQTGEAVLRAVSVLE